MAGIFFVQVPHSRAQQQLLQVPAEKVIQNWHDSTPEDFIFTVKANRFFTHIKRLKDCAYDVNNFISKFDVLQNKLGPFLYQLPPSLKRDDDLLSSFLSVLPVEYRHIVEFRHESWLDGKVFDILHKHNTGICVFDMPELECPLIATANFAYIRFHGNINLYASKYTKEELRSWAGRIKNMPEKPDPIYIYFNNDTAGYAFDNAETIRGFLL